MEISWEVEDGYCGKSRPQRTIIDDEDFEDCTTAAEVEEVINDAIQSDYDQFGWCITDETEKDEMLEKLGIS